MVLSSWFVGRMPLLPNKLRRARIPDSPEYYVKKMFMTSIFATFAVVMLAFAFIKTPIALFGLVLLPLFFSYFLHYADVRIIQDAKKIDQEIVYAGRFLIIELESGVPLYDTFQNLAKNYKHIGAYFQEIVDMVSLGTSVEQAMNQALEFVPSASLRKLFWQILNSLRTGSEISQSLNTAVDQIVREQRIAVVEYGRKLNPLAMFYMMIAIIIPSLGTTMAIVMAIFVGIQLNLVILLVVAGALLVMQLMFLAVIRAQRPPVAF